MVRVKICCVKSAEEARLAISAGASALGFVSEMPSGPGVIGEGAIAKIIATVPPPIATFLLTSRSDPAEITAQQRRCCANTIQLCDRLTVEAHLALREALPGISLVQVVHVSDESSIDEALELGRRVDAILLDSGNQSAPVKELGGTGRTHDWSLSKRIVQGSTVPVFLAGGLRAANVEEALHSTGAFGVDVCSGVRTNGSLDGEKLSSFMEAVERAAQQIAPADRRPTARAAGG